MTTIEQNTAARIRLLNDTLRATGAGGRTMITAGVSALDAEDQAAVLTAVRAFEDFTADNDPYGEHDCAVVQVDHHSVIWKIDYYDVQLEALSPDPADPAQTSRVLAIMLSSDY
jgi:hypothetical protein